MKRNWRMIGLALVLVFGYGAARGGILEEVPPELAEYVARPEPDFAWKLNGTHPSSAGTLYDVELVSQKWQGIVWKHFLHIHEPKHIRHPRHVLLFISGGRNGRQPGTESIEMGLRLAELAGARVATLYQVPNQPLLGGRREDDLITETWLRYLDTGDANWPLLFPMVKSAVKAMDAIQEIAKTQWTEPVAGFVITGGSKRGWTSWLSAVVDKRIVATAPIVIDTLNFRGQMRHQIATWGRYSEQIRDYTSKGLIKEGDETPREAHLRRMMDPYTYRQQLTLPKLLINATNDRYWVVDAMNYYWDDLVGPKYVFYVPNAGHSLSGGRQRAFSTLAAFFQHIATGSSLPKLQWKHSDSADGFRLMMRSSRSPSAARLWTAYSSSKDFREANWRSQPLEPVDGQMVAEVAKPASGYVAFFGELQFDLAGLPYWLSTQIRRE